MDGLKVYVGTVEIVHLADIVSNLLQLAVCFYCASRVIQVPHYEQEHTVSIFDKFVWESHEALFLIIASTINSNRLIKHLFDSDMISSIYKDEDISIIGFIMTDKYFHYLVERIVFFIRIFLMSLGVAFILINTLVRSKNTLFNNIKMNIKLLERIIPTIYFIVVIFYGTTFIIEFNEDTLKKTSTAELPEHLKERRFEFFIENVGNIIIPLACILFIWYEDKNDINHLSTMFVFNTVIVGLYSMCITIKIAYSMYYLHNGINTYWYIILLYLVTAVGVTGLKVYEYKNTSDGLRDILQTFYSATGGKTTPVTFLWRIGIVLGIIGFVLSLISTQAQWFTFNVEAGKIPMEVEKYTSTIINDIDEFGNTIFDAVKKLDPCRWNLGDNSNTNINSTIKYEYPTYNNVDPPSAQGSDFNVYNHDILKSDCKCADKSSNCPCNYINGIKSHSSDKRYDQTTAANNNDIAKVHNYNSYKEIDENSQYVEHMRQCHATECEIVLAVAVASELTIVLDAVASLFPIPGIGAVSEAAWYAQMANRIGHGVVKMGISIGKMLIRLTSKLKYFEPLVSLLLKLAELDFKVSYRMSLDLLLIYVPVFVNGMFCILIGFWRRINVQKFMHNISIVTTFYVPLFFVNMVMIGLLYIFPIIIWDICSIFKNTNLLTVTPEEHAGFTILKWSYIFSTGGAFALMCASLLDDSYYFRKKIKQIQQLFRTLKVTHMSNRETSVNTGVNIYNYVDNGWLQAFIISFPVLFFILAAYHYDWIFTNVNYGPSGTLLEIVSSFHGHTNIIRDSTTIQDEVTDGLCGLIGKGVRELTKLVIENIEKASVYIVGQLEHFVDSILHLSNIITAFKDTGKIGVNILESSWSVAEKCIVLIIPTCVTVLMLVAVLGLPKIVEKKTRDDVEKTIKQLILMGIYYNVILNVMMQQLFASISNLNLYIFYFRFDPGFLVTLGYIASGLNAMSLFSLYVQNMYPVEIVEE